MTRGLLDMPKVVMSKIMEDIGIKEILNLRKVCHNLRNFIDDAKPNVNLEEIWISRDSDDYISVFYQCSEGSHYVKYEKHMVNEIFGENEDFMTVSMKDFEIVLRHQKSVLKELTVTEKSEIGMNEILLENIRSALKSRDHPLKLEKFTAEHMDQNQIISILPFFDSNTLNTLEVYFGDDHSEIDQLIESDQWKTIKHIVFETAIDLKYIDHLTHFSTVDVSFKSDHFPNLALLKNLFLKWSAFKHIEIRPSDYDNDDVQRSMESLGGAFFEFNLEKDFRHTWYYRIPATNQILQISVNNECLLSKNIQAVLERIEENEVPEEAVIQN